MSIHRRFASVVAALALVLAFSSVASAAANHRQVQLLDNCDPASFNAALGPGSCVRTGGGVTFDSLVDQLLSTGRVASWRFSPSSVKLAEGGTITAINRGGEAHSFTEVAAYGGGCIPEINALLGLSPVTECEVAATFATIVPPGGSLTTAPLAAGVHNFQCIIHPWQRTTVAVD